MKKQAIFILSLFQHGDKARYSTLAHLLRGKRTTSILLYGFFYDVLPYFSLLPKVSDKQINQIVQTLLQENLLIEEHPGMVQISQKGCRYLADNPLVDYHGLMSFKYGRLDDRFMELLLFATQVVSEYCHGNVTYQPIETNGHKQYLIRRWFQGLPKDRHELGHSFHQEWQQLIVSYPEPYRDFIVAYLSGHGQIGQTAGQLAEQAGISPFEVNLISKKLCHLGIEVILKSPESYPYMQGLYKQIDTPVVNESALKTYQLFQAGWTIDELCQGRRLKRSTVSDHLLEWAIIRPDFDFSRLLSESESEVLKGLLAHKPNVRDWRYGDLGEASDKVSFLAFRCFQIQQVRQER